MFETFRLFLGHICRWFITTTVKYMRQARVIMDRAGISPYLSRFYITRRPTMPDGSEPFDVHGDPKPEIIWPKEKWGLYLHRFHRGDDDMELHNHPWDWAISFIFVGGYVEERRIGDEVTRRKVLPFSLNFIKQNDFHRVELIEKDAWSLFLVGPKNSSWGFWNRDTGKFTPWREFIDQQVERAKNK